MEDVVENWKVGWDVVKIGCRGREEGRGRGEVQSGASGTTVSGVVEKEKRRKNKENWERRKNGWIGVRLIMWRGEGGRGVVKEEE